MLSRWLGQRMQFGELKRREIITLLGSAAVAWPLAARAQQVDRIWRIGYLSATETEAEPQAQSGHLIMEAALARLGYVQGKNLVIERRLLSDRTEQVNEAAIKLAATPPRALVAETHPVWRGP